MKSGEATTSTLRTMTAVSQKANCLDFKDIIRPWFSHALYFSQHRPTRVLRQQDFWNKHCTFCFTITYIAEIQVGFLRLFDYGSNVFVILASVCQSELWPMAFLGTQDPGWALLKDRRQISKKAPLNRKICPDKTPVSLSTLTTSTHVFLVLVQGTVHTVVWSPRHWTTIIKVG